MFTDVRSVTADSRGWWACKSRRTCSAAHRTLLQLVSTRTTLSCNWRAECRETTTCHSARYTPINFLKYPIKIKSLEECQKEITIPRRSNHIPRHLCKTPQPGFGISIVTWTTNWPRWWPTPHTSIPHTSVRDIAIVSMRMGYSDPLDIKLITFFFLVE